MRRFLGVVWVGLVLGGPWVRGAAVPAVGWPAAFAETTLADFNAAKAMLAVDGAVTYEAVADPAGLVRTVLKASFPASAEGGPEPLALKLPAKALASADWRGHDLLALWVYTPGNEAVDIGLLVRAGEGRCDQQATLQPNVWNAVLLTLSASTDSKLPLEAIEEVQVCVTRPVRALTLYLSTLTLLKERDLKAVEFPPRLSIARFEADDERGPWQANGVKARVTDAARMEGRRALELTFPAYQEGALRRPSYQARYAARALPLRDWRGYEQVCFEARNPGHTEAPLQVCFTDMAGAQATVAATVPARGRLAFAAALRDLAVDTSRLVQVDLFMCEPATEQTIWVDDLRLEAAPLIPADRLLERLDRAGRAAAQGGATELVTAYRQTREVVTAMRLGFEQQPTFGAARALAAGLGAATRQADRLDQDLQSRRQPGGGP